MRPLLLTLATLLAAAGLATAQVSGGQQTEDVACAEGAQNCPPNPNTINSGSTGEASDPARVTQEPATPGGAQGDPNVGGPGAAVDNPVEIVMWVALLVIVALLVVGLAAWAMRRKEPARGNRPPE